MSVYVFEEPDPRSVTWTYYFAFDSGLMFCATNKQFLGEVLSRRSRPSGAEAFPVSLPQWRYISDGAPFWAIRKFTPSSSKGAQLHDDKLVGYSVSLDKELRLLTVVSISGNPRGHQIATDLWGSFLRNERAPKPLEMTKVDEQTTKIVLDARARNGQVAVFILFGVFGHPIFV
ncbi:MAG: hypothetical protein HYR64_07555 [Fimbriimonas ginsengisoli]|uniref:Uncharacterized protein n=1 Tax=Fimbriimonas ginsengisoli TaxID=1005039 RepID=A0A931PW51_FIMGI|nr:hypothetical protein [Fimbriimonas ginsengisoli]